MNPQIFLYYDEKHIIYHSENNSKKTSQPSIWQKIIFYPKLWIYSAPNDHLDGGNTFIIVVASRLPNKLNFGWTKKNVCCGSFFAAVQCCCCCQVVSASTFHILSLMVLRQGAYWGSKTPISPHGLIVVRCLSNTGVKCNC